VPNPLQCVCFLAATLCPVHRSHLKLSATLFILSVASSFLASCSSKGPALIAFTHVTVIDPASATVYPDSTVIVNHSKIDVVGPSSTTPIPPGAQIIDAAGKFLLPGLVDMHIHLTGAGEPTGSREFIFPLLVANGITTVRDMGGQISFLKQLRKEVDSHKRLGPRIFFTGPYFDGDPPSFQPAIVIRDYPEATRAVAQLKSDGVDFIKVQSRLQPQGFFSIARASHENGMRFVGHVPDSISSAAASDAGQASIEHLTGVLLSCSSREDELRQRQLASSPLNGTLTQSQERMRAWQENLLTSYSEQKAAALFKKFAENRTAQVPTLPLLLHLAFLTPETNRTSDPQMKYIPGNLRTTWAQGRLESLANQTEADVILRKQFALKSLALVNDMYHSGVSLMAGTDSAAPNVFPGFSLHEDVWYMVQAGLSPMQALQAATSTPARFLGFANQQGAIASGQRADLLLLDANPLDEIHNTQKIRAVVLNGKFLDRAALDELLTNAERFAATH
jgi:imidazolonepropionase-like amidohydrolase